MNKLNNSHLLEITIAFAGALITGWLIKKLFLPVLYRFTKKTPWKSDELIVESMAGWVIFWAFLGACLYSLPILEENVPWFLKKDWIISRTLSGLFILSITWVVARIVAGLLEIRSASDNSILPSTSILGNIAKSLVYVTGFILILQNFGVAIAPLVTALGVGGLAVALALQPTLSNLFSGLQIIASGKMNIGDMIQLENGKKGVITDITWRNTIIKTAQNNLIVLPNSKMSDSIVENFFLYDKEVSFEIPLSVDYKSNLEIVEKTIIDEAQRVLSVHGTSSNQFEPVVRFTAFGQSSIDLKVIIRVKEWGDQFVITSEFIKAIVTRFAKEGIEIPYPARTIYTKN